MAQYRFSKESLVSVPRSIEQVLSKNKIPYDVAQVADVSHKTEAQVKLLRPFNSAAAKVLKGEGKRLFVIHSQDALIDIKCVNEQMQGEFTPLVGQPLMDLLAKFGGNVAKMPAIPMVTDMITLVDKNLLNAEHVFLESGMNDEYIKLDQNGFKQLIGDAHVSEFTTPLKPLEVSSEPGQDRYEIEHSVSQFTELRIKKRLEDTLEFPPLPVTANKIVQLRVDPHADIGDLTDIVELDASLAAQVVSWAGSPYYSAPGAIKSIHDAIVRVLGFDMVLNLALGLSLGRAMKMPSQLPAGYMPYWQQSVFVAAATEALVTCIPRQDRPSFGTAYLTGLLNNFGYLIISEVFESKFETLCQHIDTNPQASVQAVERHVLGVDRNQLAAWLMGFWNMPEPLIVALRHQSSPEYDGEHWEYPLLIFLANHLLQEKGVLTGVSNQPVPDSVFTRLNINREDAVEAIGRLLESREELIAIAKQMG